MSVGPVLSIGKISAGQQQYYESQVARGRDDYYSGRGEAPGHWTGELAAELGLEGQVASATFNSVLQEHRDPRSGEVLREPSKIVAYDFTFSAPKSVSVLYAVGDERTSAAIRDAHEEAVTAAMKYLESEVACGRRGKGGTERVEISGLASGRYRHRLSRAGDPQLHTHVVTANLAQGTDGKWGALHAYPIHQSAKAIGSLYQAHLRGAVRERLPWVEWSEVTNGVAEIDGVPEAVRDEFSTRRKEILEWAAEHKDGEAGRRMTNAVMATRPAKDHAMDREEVWSQFRARAAEHGFGAEELAELTEREAGRESAPVTDGAAAQAAHRAGGELGLERHLAQQLAGAAGATRMRNTFGPRHVVTEVAAAARQGARVADIVGSSERVLASDGMIYVNTDLDEGRRFTSQNLVDCETSIVDGVERRRDEGVGRLDPDAAKQTLAGRTITLNDGQQKAFEHVTSSGHGFDHIEALAGTGKTTLLGAIADSYRAQGYRVLGVSKTGRAVRELKETALVPESHTAASLLHTFERFDTGFGTEPTVLLFDEAAMDETREASRLLEQAERDGVKVIAVGDSGQLPAVEAGGWFGALSRRFGAVQLAEVMRQRDPRERVALANVRDGKPGRWVELKTERGDLRVHATPEAAERAALETWREAIAEVGPTTAVMVARDNSRRERLNDAAREQLKSEQLIDQEGVQIGEREFVVGDRVIARRNDRLRDVDNGMRGTVVAVDVDEASVVLESDSGGRRELDREYIEEHLDHAYALTGHGMQGGTVDRAVVVGRPDEFSRNWGYTALSRARDSTVVELVSERREPAGREELAPGEDLRRTPTETVQSLSMSLRRSDVEDLALEQLEAAELEQRAERPVVAQPLAQEAAADRLDVAARAPEVDTAAIDRDTIEVPDPLAPTRRVLGAERSGRLPEVAATDRQWLADRSDRELAELQAEHAAAVERLDTAAAYETGRLEREARVALSRRDQATARISQLERHRAELSPFQRGERRGLEQQIASQRRVVQHEQTTANHSLEAAEDFRTAGRHPDLWVEANGRSAVRWSEVTRERAVRRELEIRTAQERAVREPPTHVRELLGERSVADVDRERYDQLARSLERHRMEYEVDVAADGPLGPEPADRGLDGRSDYARSRRDLAERVAEHRVDRGLEAETVAVEIDGPDPGLGI